ncbi:MAG: DUF3108 domain-containing protein [Maritimibacter sp.]
MKSLKGVVFSFLTFIAAPACAETANFQVRLSGIPVGQMVLQASHSESGYSVTSKFRTTGVAGIIAKVAYVMRAKGRGQIPNIRSNAYSEDMNTGYRASNVNLTFANSDSRIDPMSAFYLALATRPVSAGCAAKVRTWDGTREMNVSLAPYSQNATQLVCKGHAARHKGYTAAELAKMSGFPFTVEFIRRGETWEPARVSVKTIHGPVTLIRR